MNGSVNLMDAELFLCLVLLLLLLLLQMQQMRTRVSVVDGFLVGKVCKLNFSSIGFL